MTTTEITLTILAGAAIILVAISLGALLRALLTSKKLVNNPTAQEIEVALDAYVYKAVAVGKTVVIAGINESDTQLQSVNEKVMADAAYDLIPSTINVLGVPIPVGIVKLGVSRERFETLVEDAFAATHAFALANEKFLQAATIPTITSNVLVTSTVGSANNTVANFTMPVNSALSSTPNVTLTAPTNDTVIATPPVTPDVAPVVPPAPVG